ncbi:spore germination protein [Cytobacillus firmus]|uniref:Protein GerPA, required for proper assembly of spore coat, mutations lead to super-dormant spore n=1 Tax=Cytobacillus firmus TaxID=1399 RepID=A0A7Y5ENT0_CYTFI|nr:MULTISPECIES: spore germination protein [Bacillales]KAF0823792.1 Protein GerPA, required for proper assembly of spore coat, mutations lead to super-dormant spore [Cytobacillus firmus]MDD9313250.1 spore germination protein [Cytobacillus firmus]MEC1891809.1 spore germination protein [Cytobacillus firmus]MED1907945.1 spore germination protein [Cytobacillus firmus]MED1939112.1 spore germination protein [Cytobacillus firmus]
MPAIVGVAQVISIGSSSVFNIGDVYKIMPVSNAKTFSGAGSFNTGDGLNVYNHRSSTNTYDCDGVDQGNYFNA